MPTLMQFNSNTMNEHINEVSEELAGLSDILIERDWSRYEARAAERCLQVLIESCIGMAKHWLKKQGAVSSSEAYVVFEKLAKRQLLNHDELLQWKKIIGMRNALVHDYLNTDESVLKAVFKSKNYVFLIDFSARALKSLAE
jgi:uncharacterized protein YutE (UPF0331/DUF86 family)